MLYLTASYRITDAVLRGRWLQPLALVLMTLNPLVLDLLVAARGYALALGLSWWSLYLSWSDLGNPNPRRLWFAGVCAGLAVTANLVFVIPLALMGFCCFRCMPVARRFWELVDSLGGPTIVLALCCCWFHFRRAQAVLFRRQDSVGNDGIARGRIVAAAAGRITLMDDLDARMGWMFLEER